MKLAFTAKVLTAVGIGAIAIAGLGASSASAAGEPWWYDTNGDGLYDLIGFDVNGDGRTDIEGYDADQNGVTEKFIFDTDYDGYYETASFDYAQDAVLDDVQFDTDLDGYLDTTVVLGSVYQGSPAPTSATISAPTDPGWFYTLMNTMTVYTGEAVFGSPLDSDGDGIPDANDTTP